MDVIEGYEIIRLLRQREQRLPQRQKAGIVPPPRSRGRPRGKASSWSFVRHAFHRIRQKTPITF